MTQARLRTVIFGLWLLLWIISTIILLVSPWLRPDRAIGPEQITAAIFSVTGVWVPAITCLAAFWFPQEEQRKAQDISVTPDRVIAAIAITVTYLAFVLVLIIWSAYFVGYDYQTKQIPQGGSFQEQIDGSVKYALLISPIALAPINWLTGGQIKQNAIVKKGA